MGNSEAAKPEKNEMTRLEIALRILEKETTNVWKWANHTEAEKVAYCYKLADELIAQQQVKEN